STATISNEPARSALLTLGSPTSVHHEKVGDIEVLQSRFTTFAGQRLRNLRETFSRDALQTAVGNARGVLNRLRPRKELNGSTNSFHGDNLARKLPADAADPVAVAIARGETWMLAMQNDDGGWGAFDRNNNREF